MEIRKIKAQTVCDTVKKLFTDCNYFIGKDIMCALETARDNESSPVGKSVLSQIIENDKIAAREEVPLCQDTGMAVLFVEYGDRVVIEDGSFDEAVNEGVRRAYIDGYLRKSVVNDPVFDRINTKDNTPAIIHTKIVSGNQIKITAGGKGFGSENMSQIKMLTPSKGIEGVKQFILDTVSFIEERSPQTVKEYNDKLVERVHDLLGDVTLDEGRILQEVAIYADKVAVAEETVRLRSHISQLRDFISSDEAVGRKLDFLIQEINRETNTIGSKCNDVEIARKVVEVKAEIEKIREQIQNIE